MSKRKKERKREIKKRDTERDRELKVKDNYFCLGQAINLRV